MKINKISPLEDDFTEVLKKLALKVKMLYFYGKLPKKVVKMGESGERPRCVAIVGSRKNTAYGREVAYTAAYEAAKAGAVVISGLAYGIDSIAHRGALDAGGTTVAVLGTPITQIYPAEHKGLAREIIEKGGAVISEYGPEDLAQGGQQTRARFLERNRIIAALADVVLVAEAAARSGTLNTAMHALDVGTEVMAVPGDITRLTSEGCNKLLSQGATAYTGTRDLLDLLFPERILETRVKVKPKTTEEVVEEYLERYAEGKIEREVLRQVLVGVTDGEEIMEKMGISSAEFGQAITMLEIKGAVSALGTNRWAGRPKM